MGRPVEKRGKLGDWVDEHGWTRQRLADQLGITLVSAARLCSGGRRPSLETRRRLGAAATGRASARDVRDTAARQRRVTFETV